MELQNHIASLVFGILGNVVSVLVFLSPAYTFVRICKRKSTEDFSCLPYSVALFSCMLYLYYATLKVDALLLISINSFGCIIESLYLVLYIIYAPRDSRICAAKLLVLFNMILYFLIVLPTYMLVHGSQRISVVGWLCAIFSVVVFAAPLSNIRKVIRSKSVEFMPFPLSLCLTFSACCWLLYGLSKKDYYIAGPNILGLGFGISQMSLFFKYKNHGNEQAEQEQEQEQQSEA